MSGYQGKWRSLIVGCAAMCTAAVAGAEQLPKWELGVGAMGFYLPDYPGAAEGRNYLIPLPLVIYRGERIRSDRDGVRAELFQGDRLMLNLSLGGSMPVRVDRNEARSGMTELPPVIEIGPALNVALARWPESRSELQLRIPVRAAFAIDGGLDNFGAVFNPFLRLQQHKARWLFDTNVAISTGPAFGSRGYHKFYYGVEPQYATPARPAYEAQSGYSGWSTWASATMPRGRWRWFTFASANWVGRAVYADGPLVKRSVTYTAGIGVGYIFAQSSQMVEDDE